MEKNKISIIGAGNVGSTIAYTMAQGQMAKEIVLIDKKCNKVLAESLDISHSLPQENDTIIRAGTYADVKNSYIIVITAGVGRSIGESRSDLFTKNAAIMKDIGINMKNYYNNSIVIVVSNPVDAMTSIVYRLLNAKREKVFGTGTLLDAARLRYELSKEFKVSKDAIDCSVIGEHSNKSIVLWDLIKIHGVNENEHLSEDRQKKILENMHLSADRIIEGKGFTSYGVAAVTCNLVNNIINSSNKTLPLSVNLNGEYGLDDVFLSLPCTVTCKGIENVYVPCLSREEIDSLRASAQEQKRLVSNI